jgi:antitoxin HicB
VRLAPLVAAKAGVYRAMREAGIDKAELARRVGIAPEAVERMLSMHRETRLDEFAAALSVLGQRLVSVEPA